MGAKDYICTKIIGKKLLVEGTPMHGWVHTLKNNGKDKTLTYEIAYSDNNLLIFDEVTNQYIKQRFTKNIDELAVRTMVVGSQFYVVDYSELDKALRLVDNEGETK